MLRIIILSRNCEKFFLLENLGREEIPARKNAGGAVTEKTDDFPKVAVHGCRSEDEN
jgi:hypothetical protein